MYRFLKRSLAHLAKWRHDAGGRPGALSAPSEQFIRDRSAALAAAGARWAAVVLVGYADDDVHSLDEASDLTTDSASGVYGMAVSWLVVDAATGASRIGGRPQRLAALEALRNHYKPDADLGHDAPDWAGERAILVSRNMANGRHRLVETKKAALAFELAGQDVLEGWLPVAVFDLDLRRMTELHITTPGVMPAADQGLTRNPLAT